jgi:hypothetical protein
MVGYWNFILVKTRIKLINITASKQMEDSTKIKNERKGVRGKP